MSKEEDKIKVATRRYNEEVKITKQVKIAKSHGMEVKEPHKLAKHHALDCGQPGCMLCGNPRKLFKEKTIQEKSFDQTGKWDSET